jgi:hypothetical protein
MCTSFAWKSAEWALPGSVSLQVYSLAVSRIRRAFSNYDFALFIFISLFRLVNRRYAVSPLIGMSPINLHRSTATSGSAMGCSVAGLSR